MAKLIRRISTESRSYKILSKLYEEGNIKVLTPEESYKIDYGIDKGFKKINDDYSVKERCSMIYINQLDSTSTLI